MTLNDRVDTQALLARVDIVDVIDRYVPLKKSGPEFEACCPFHNESTPSFKVSPSKQIYHCFGCGANGDAIGFLRAHQGLSFKEAVAALGGDSAMPAQDAPQPAPARVAAKRSIWTPVLPAPIDAPEPPKAHIKRGLPEQVWCYRDACGQVLGWVYRFNTSDGGKEVLPLVWARNEDTGALEWHWMAFPEPRPLYGLDRLAAKPDATVLLVEGEKCADAGNDALPDLAVLSWPGGGKAYSKVDWLPLSGRRVMTWADADAKREPLTREERDVGLVQEDKPLLPDSLQPGVETMARIRERLRAMDCRLWDVRLPPPGSKPDGWDIADAVMEGLRGKALADYVRENAVVAVPQMARPVPDVPDVPDVVEQVGTVPEPRGTEQNKTVRQSEPLMFDAAEWLEKSTPQEWIVDGLIQRGMLYALTAVTNHGKTAVSLTLALSVASGKAFAGRTTLPGKVLILCGENPDGFRTRTKATLEALGLEPGDIAGLVTILPRALPLVTVVDRIVAELQAVGEAYSLVLVDTSVSYFSGDNEDDNLQARTHAWNLRALTELPGRPAIIANVHPTKSATKDTLLPRGGGAFTNEIDTNLTVWSEGEVATLHWHHKKRGPDFDPIPFEFHGRTVIEHGLNVPTVVASHITDQRALEIRRARNQDEDRLLYALDHFPDDTFANWATHCGWNGDKAKSKVSRVLARLMEDKLVTRNRKGWVLTSMGKNEAASIRYWRDGLRSL
jgi:hypothetical protein